MKTKEEVFTLIKKTVNLPGEINDYQLRLSSGRFERENLIGIYKIRRGIAARQENFKLAEQMSFLLIGLENDTGILLKGANIYGKNYFGMYYLSEDWNKVIGYLESEVDENGNLIN